MRNLIISVVASLLLLSGCGSMDQTSRTIVGSQVGSLAGGIVGAIIGDNSGRWDGAALGSTIGSFAGGAAGAIIGANMETEQEKREKRNDRYITIDRNAPFLVVDDIFLEDTNGNQAIDAGESCRLTFILLNNGRRDALRVKPIVTVEKGKSHLKISDPVVIRKISPDDRVTYTVNVRASRKLRTGKAVFAIHMEEQGGHGMEKQTFTVETQGIKN
ncbi:glycine zipper domain-containing protein [Parabacteroides sp. AM08-6]|uniref:glycine zipper domain-containing protein n=1 Tax=Parabacteroides sp. AM08-6 TaxID=2292053 RepID=UPI000F0079DB|nr:glycine zipper domain-containing protein [Parabacteroides sp. AM08-6]RHJ87675.1 glycine zipper family protein [Parabacteroides sp. AM08-6]